MSGHSHDNISRDAHDDSPISLEDKQKDFFISEEQYNPQLMPHTGRLPEPEKFVRNMQVTLTCYVVKNQEPNVNIIIAA